MSIDDAAVYLGIDRAAFLRLMAKDAFADAWTEGRRKLEATLHSALLKEAMAGKVTAIRFALNRLDQMRNDVADAIRRRDDPEDEGGGAGVLTVDDFAQAYEDMVRNQGAGA